MTTSVPTDAEMLDALRRAKHKLVLDIAGGKAARRISMPEMTVEAQDSDKLLEKLDRLEDRYAMRVQGRRGISLRAS